MKLFKTTKGKAVVLALAVFLVAGGAVAGASSPGFASTIQSYVAAIQGKIMTLIGNEVDNKVATETTEVKTHVTNKFNAATGEIVGHYSLEMQNNLGRLTANKEAAKAEIDAAVTSATAQVKHTITETAEDEVTDAITKMNADINTHINSIMQGAVTSIPQ